MTHRRINRAKNARIDHDARFEDVSRQLRSVDAALCEAKSDLNAGHRARFEATIAESGAALKALMRQVYWLLNVEGGSP